MDVCAQDEMGKRVLQTKSYLLNAYSMTDTDNWEYIKEEIGKSRKEFEMINDNVESKKENIGTQNGTISAPHLSFVSYDNIFRTNTIRRYIPAYEHFLLNQSLHLRI